MGIALADAAAEYGADVELVLGPVEIWYRKTNVNTYNRCYKHQ
jgi:phosphopantothenoylcysteine synthetase/decarboxylase